jgi:DNA-binding NtrC family response regulator/PAS domain-containing protein
MEGAVPNDPAVPSQVQADTLAELAGLAYFQVDAERNVVAMSPAMERLTGFSSDQVLGRSCLTVNRCQECLRECGVFRHGLVNDVPLKLFRADGTDVAVYKSGKVFRDDNGLVVGALEVVRPAAPGEVTAPRHGPPPEMDFLLKGLGRLFMVADASMNVVAHGAALSGFTGIPHELLIGLPLESLLGPELFGPDAAFRQAMEQGERREGWAAELRRDDGSTAPVSLTVGPLDPTGTCSGVDGRYVLMMRPEEHRAVAPSFQGVVARSPAMQRIFRLVELLRDNDSTVLVTGESGTGKELVARALHGTSHRKEGPFVAVNCAAIPPELLESELFGHVRGAFTGAVKDRAGRFELAEGGTLFLDEIGDLALSLQAKILRFLQERTFERVGDSRTRTVDVRVIAATHVNLVKAVSERRFREDLYYRLRVVPMHIPAIRERREDLELLVRHFLEEIGRKRGRALRLAPSASRALLTYPWPGNVRELENALEYATTVCEGQTIHVGDLPREVGLAQNGGLVHEGFQGGRDDPEDLSGASRDRGALLAPGLVAPIRTPAATAEEVHEVRRIRLALEQAHYRRAEAARILGMSRTTLWRKMREHGL